MSRILVTDAKIALERAGYIVNDYGYQIYADCVCLCCGTSRNEAVLEVTNGTVDNADVVDLLAERGYDEHGYRRN